MLTFFYLLLWVKVASFILSIIFLSSKMIRTKDPSTACILDAQHEFLYKLLQQALADPDLVQQYGLEIARQQYQDDPVSLYQVVGLNP